MESYLSTHAFPKQLSSSTPPLNSVLCAVSAQVARILVKSYHDTEAKLLPRLVIGQPIRVKAHHKQAHSKWKPGVIVDSVALRSYIVKVDGRKYRCLVQSSPAKHATNQYCRDYRLI